MADASAERQTGEIALSAPEFVIPEPIRVIAVTSGKGGVGKTNLSANLAVALAAANKEVMLLDANLALANVDVLLGLNPKYNLAHVLNGECALEDTILRGPGGVKIVPAASGVDSMARLCLLEHAGLIRAFSGLNQHLDVLIIDTGPGISDDVAIFTCASQEVIVVLCDEPACVANAYALVKVLSCEHRRTRFRVVANMVQDETGGWELYNKLLRLTERFLDVSLDYAGAVPHDEYLRRAVQRQRAVVEKYPMSKAAQAFRKLAEKVDKWPLAGPVAGHLQFFFDRLIHQVGAHEPKPQGA